MAGLWRIRRSGWTAAMAGVLATLALPAAARAEPVVTAHQIYSDASSQTWYGTCYSSNGRYAMTVRHYLHRETRKLYHPTNWTVTLVSGSMSDFLTGTGVRNRGAYLTKWRYRGADGHGPTPIGDWVRNTDNYGTFSYFPEQNQTLGLLRARWWYHRDLKEWYFDAHRQAADFDGNGTKDCSVIFAYSYPWTAPPNQRPRR
jgi:hypothetical protein